MKSLQVVPSVGIRLVLISGIQQSADATSLRGLLVDLITCFSGNGLQDSLRQFYSSSSATP